jgi:hypothetical protein
LPYLGDVIVFAVEAVEIGGDLVVLNRSFAHVLVVGRVDQNHTLAVRLMKIEDSHGVHAVDVAVEVGYSVAVADALSDSDQGDSYKESDDQADLAVGDVGSLRW